MTGAGPPLPVLAIETSCDETSVALVDGEFRILAHEVYSQIEEHAPFGGVVPELASREHLARLPSMVNRILDAALREGHEPRSIAVTVGPGLIGSLLVGVSFAQGLGYARGIPVHPVHHVVGHVAAVRLSARDFAMPYLALVVSGGHTELILVESERRLTRLAGTIDDAAGEAFDKAARLLGAGYPGGPMIEKLAATAGGPPAMRLSAPIMPGEAGFSFSGLKTALKNHLARRPRPVDADRAEAAAAFQREVVASLVEKTARALDETRAPRLLLSGGVAANSLLRDEMARMAEARGVFYAVPDRAFCTDNAAMIAAAAIAFPTPAMALADSGSPSLGLNELFAA